jgi:hypothetical protein
MAPAHGDASSGDAGVLQQLAGNQIETGAFVFGQNFRARTDIFDQASPEAGDIFGAYGVGIAHRPASYSYGVQ